MIYAAVVTYSIPDLDNKKHLRQVLEAFPTEQQAKDFVDRCFKEWDDKDSKYARVGNVFTIEEVRN